MFKLLSEAFRYKNKYLHLIGKTLEPENSRLLKLIVIQSDKEFYETWGNQTLPNEDEDLLQVLSDEEFKKQIKELEEIESKIVQAELSYMINYDVIGIFRLQSGSPRFHPLDTLLYENDL